MEQRDQMRIELRSPLPISVWEMSTSSWVTDQAPWQSAALASSLCAYLPGGRSVVTHRSVQVCLTAGMKLPICERMVFHSMVLKSSSKWRIRRKKRQHSRESVN